MRRLLLPALLAGAFLSTSTIAQGLTPQQVMNLDAVRSVAANQDGSWLIYTVRRTRPLADGPVGAKTTAYVMKTDGGEAIELPSANHVQWHPDGERVTWLGSAQGSDVPQVLAMRPGTDEAPKTLSKLASAARDFHWSPDGTAFAFTALDPMPGSRREARSQGFTAVVVEEQLSHVSLWHHDIASGSTRRLTQGGTVREFEWSPDSSKLVAAVSARNTIDDFYVGTKLQLIDVKAGTEERFVDNPGKLGGGTWSADGKSFFVISAADQRDPHAGMLYEISLEDREMRPVLPGLRGMVHQVSHTTALGLHMIWSRGVESILSIGDGSQSLPCAARSFTSLGDGRFAVVGSTASHPEEVFVQGADGGWRRRTFHNEWLSKVRLGRQEVVRFEARDGLEIEGLLIHPIDRADRDRAPMVVVAHGGPEAHFSNGWITRYSEPGQVLAARGMFAWYPNYRSSTGYGVEFAKEDHGDPMGREFHDHLDAIDLFVERGLVDRDRVGVIGGSYGGYTAAWAATRHTEHFAAAVSFVPFVDIRTKWLTSDIPMEFFHVHYEQTWPHQQRGFLSDRSPLTYAADCRTPLLLAGGDSDTRVHPSQPHMLWRAVQFGTDTPVRYVQYPGEGHGNRRNVHQYDYMLRGLRWLEHYLGSGATRELAPPPADLDYPAWTR